jgi:hypothetical protein
VNWDNRKQKVRTAKKNAIAAAEVPGQLSTRTFVLCGGLYNIDLLLVGGERGCYGGMHFAPARKSKKS